MKDAAKKHSCPKCGGLLPCRTGSRHVPRRPTWRRRVRCCADCGHVVETMEVPKPWFDQMLKKIKS